MIVHVLTSSCIVCCHSIPQYQIQPEEGGQSHQHTSHNHEEEPVLDDASLSSNSDAEFQATSTEQRQTRSPVGRARASTSSSTRLPPPHQHNDSGSDEGETEAPSPPLEGGTPGKKAANSDTNFKARGYHRFSEEQKQELLEEFAVNPC